MGTNKRFKRITDALYIVLIALASDYTSPILAANMASHEGQNIPKETYKSVIYCDKTLNAYDYLTRAQIITEMSAKDDWTCKEYSATVFDIYSELVKVNGRKDLENKIRLAYNLTFGHYKEGHAWIEVNEGRRWIPFETITANAQLKDEDYKADYKSIPGTKIVYPVSRTCGLHDILLKRIGKEENQ